MGWSVETGAGGTHVICYCADCQTFARHLGQSETALDADGGTEIFQTLPDAVRITRGADSLALLRLGPKGLMRWYAGCCNTPIANTLANPRTLPFIGMILPPGSRALAPSPPGSIPPPRATRSRSTGLPPPAPPCWAGR